MEKLRIGELRLNKEEWKILGELEEHFLGHALVSAENLIRKIRIHEAQVSSLARTIVKQFNEHKELQARQQEASLKSVSGAY